jgi:hypothetical protein
MKTIKLTYSLFSILFLFILTNCAEKEITNPFDTNCPKELFTPSDFKAEQEGTTVKLSWKQTNTQISGSVISRNENDGAMTEVTRIDKTVTSWNDPNVKGGIKYGYRLAAYAGDNQSNTVTAFFTPVYGATVSTDAVTGITSTSAVMGGNITNEGGATVTGRGVCYSTSVNPTTSDNKVEMGSGAGAFSLPITGLTAGTTYYARAYGINSQGTTYGTPVTFTTSFLTISPNSSNVPKESGSKEFTVASNIDWQVSSNQPWCTLSANSGKGNGSITVTYTENKEVPQRTATITFTGTGVASQTAIITQAGIEPPALTITPANQNVTNPAGTATFNITSNVGWTAQSDQAWCTVTNNSGTGNATLNLNYEANTTYNQRITTITISGIGLLPKAITLTQAGTEPPVLTITPANQNVTNIKGTTTFDITSNVSWTATCDQEWCILTNNSGNGNGKVNVNYSQNDSKTQRIATITIKANGLENKIVTISQQTILVNVALANFGATASAISVGSYSGTRHAFYAIDGDSITFWASNWSMPGWLKVQFNKTYTITRVGVWFGEHKHTFKISLSTDGTNWTEVVSSRLSINGEASKPMHEIFEITPTLARFIKCDITTTSAPGSHIFQSSLHELEAFGF